MADEPVDAADLGRDDAQPPPKRLVCIVEGKGDAAAVPALCGRVMKLGPTEQSWFVDDDPIRFSRGQLVNEQMKSPSRTANANGLQKAARLACARPADAILVLCDADDDCAATWGTDAKRILDNYGPAAAVMAVREYEAWLLCSMLKSNRVGGRHVESIRDAKGELRERYARYKPTVHQGSLTKELDVGTVWALSDSFDKLVRDLARLFGAGDVRRPHPPK